MSATARSWARLDLATREFWRVVGRPVDLAGSEQWLDAPCGGAATIGAEWFESAATALGGCVDRDAADAGLVADLTVLDGPDFSAASLHPLVREFYEHSARFRLEAWSQWSPFFAPGGMVVTQVFGRRIQQLALPVRPLDLARGMDSQVVPVMDATGHQRWAGWIRRLRSTVADGCTRPGCRSTSASSSPWTTRASCEPTTSCVSGRRPHSACTTGWTGGRVRGRLDASPESTRRGEHAAYRKNVRCG